MLIVSSHISKARVLLVVKFFYAAVIAAEKAFPVRIVLLENIIRRVYTFWD